MAWVKNNLSKVIRSSKMVFSTFSVGNIIPRCCIQGTFGTGISVWACIQLSSTLLKSFFIINSLLLREIY